MLRAMAEGGALKSHRDLNGKKVYRLHPLRGPVRLVNRATVTRLEQYGLIHSNQKFPVAAYLLTDRGRDVAAQLTSTEVAPLFARNFIT